jgi:hypothetical protein
MLVHSLSLFLDASGTAIPRGNIASKEKRIVMCRALLELPQRGKKAEIASRNCQPKSKTNKDMFRLHGRN